MDCAHVYCRRYGSVGRFAIDHAGLRDHPDTALLLKEGMTPCEVKSMIFTSESGVVCIALGSNQQFDATMDQIITTYVLQIPLSDLVVVVQQLVERGVSTVCMHYVSVLDKDIDVASHPPNDSQLAGADERPSLPCTTTLSVSTLAALCMISSARENHVMP